MSNKQLEHILFMNLKEDMTETQIKGLTDCIEELKTIRGVIKISFGKNFSERNGGYNWGFSVLFEKVEDLAVYGPHPIHEKFKTLLNEVRVSPPVVSDFISIV